MHSFIKIIQILVFVSQENLYFRQTTQSRSLPVDSTHKGMIKHQIQVKLAT